MNIIKKGGFIFLIAFLLRIIASFFFGDKMIDMEFHVLVTNFMNGHGFSYWAVSADGSMAYEVIDGASKYLPSAYMPVLYPLFLATIVSFIGYTESSVFIILIIQSLMGAFSCLLIKDLYELKFDKKNSYLTAWLAAFFPLHILMSSQTSASNLYVFLIICVLYSYHLLIKNNSEKTALALGLFLGLLTLARADAILLIPAIFILLTFFHKKIHMKNRLFIILFSFLTIMPYSARNYHHFDFIYPLTVSGGFNLWVGNNENATGSNYSGQNIRSKEMIDKINLLKKDNMYEKNWDEIHKEEAILYMKENPLRVVQLSIKKVIFFWVHIYDKSIKYPGLNHILYWGPWIAMLPFFILSLPLVVKNYRRNELEIFMLLYFTFVYSVFFVLPRYRLIVFPIYLLFSFYYINRKLPEY